MINQATYLNAATVAKELADKNIYLQARPTSVLGELLDLSTSVLAENNTDLPRILVNPNTPNQIALRSAEERANAVQYTTGDYHEPSQHSLKLMALAEDLAPFITSHISHARNTVAPLVVDLSDKLQKYLDTAKPLDPVSLFEIEQRSLPALVVDESFQADGLEAYAGTDAKYRSFPHILDVPEEDSFYQDLVNLGSNRLNGLVNDWLKTKDPSFIKAVYIVNFSNQLDALRTVNGGSYEGLYSLGDPGVGNNPYDTLDLSLAIYLIGTRLISNVVPAKGVSLVEYKSAMRSMIDYAGAQIHKSLKAVQRQHEANVLVTEAIISKKKIVVNKIIYRSWLESGGQPEVLLGMLASGEVHYAVGAIEEAKEKLLRQWANYVMLSQTNIKAEMHKRFRDYAENEVMMGLNELTDLEKEYAQNCVNFKDRVQALVNEEIEHLSHRLMDDVHHTALHLIAKARFFYTSAYSILNEMATVAKDNPNIDPREAALLSVISYVGEYFEEQIVCVK